jgi:hypothetical protein
MTTPSETLAITVRTAKELERLGIPYLLGGSLASMLHGEPRATLDVDFALHMTAEQARELAVAMEREFYVLPDALVEAARTQGMANVIHRASYLKVDLHVRPRLGHHREEIRRALPMQVGDSEGDTVRVATAEDVVLQKLRWYRLGNEVSDRQWRDVAGVLKSRGSTLDRSYLEHWARELGVSDLLARALLDSQVD